MIDLSFKDGRKMRFAVKFGYVGLTCPMYVEDFISVWATVFANVFYDFYRQNLWRLFLKRDIFECKL